MITVLAILILPTYLILCRVWDTFDNYLRCKTEQRLRSYQRRIGFKNAIGEQDDYEQNGE